MIPSNANIINLYLSSITLSDCFLPAASLGNESQWGTGIAEKVTIISSPWNHVRKWAELIPAVVGILLDWRYVTTSGRHQDSLGTSWNHTTKQKFKVVLWCFKEFCWLFNKGKSCSVSLTCVSIPASCRWGQSCLKWWHHSQVGHYVSPLQSDANHCPRLHIQRSFSNVDGLFWALTLPWSFIKSCFS